MKTNLIPLFSNYKKICGFTNAKVVMSVNYSYLNVSTRTVGRTTLSSVKKSDNHFQGFFFKIYFSFLYLSVYYVVRVVLHKKNMIYDLFDLMDATNMFYLLWKQSPSKKVLRKALFLIQNLRFDSSWISCTFYNYVCRI